MSPRRNRDSRNPSLSPASVPLPPEPGGGGGGAHPPAGEGLHGESQFRRLENKLSTLPTLWTKPSKPGRKQPWQRPRRWPLWMPRRWPLWRARRWPLGRPRGDGRCGGRGDGRCVGRSDGRGDGQWWPRPSLLWRPRQWLLWRPRRWPCRVAGDTPRTHWKSGQIETSFWKSKCWCRSIMRK